MPVVSICDLSKYDGQEVTVRGWLYNIRSSGKIIFPILRDGSGLLQCIVFKNNVSPEVFEKAKALTQESSLELTGTARKVPEGKSAPGGYELDVKDLVVVQLVPAGAAVPDYSEGTWHRVPDGSAPPLDSLVAPACHFEDPS